MLRVPAPAAALLQPYRLPAGAALRGLVREPGGEGAPEAVPAIDPTGTITHPGATIAAADPRRLASALGFTLDE
jgi:hypothetical protein